MSTPDTGQAREPGAESPCLCGPDLTGECIDSRPDCPRHGYDYSVSGMVTAPELARAWWDSLEGDRPFWESLDQSAQAGYVELAAKWIQRACRNTAEVASGDTVQAPDGPPAGFWDESGSTSPVIDWSPVPAPNMAALPPDVVAVIEAAQAWVANNARAGHTPTGPAARLDAAVCAWKMRDDLTCVEELIAAARADYPGLPRLRRHRDELAALLAADDTTPGGAS